MVTESFSRNQRHLVGQMALRQPLAFVDQNGPGIVEPRLDHRLNGVVAPAHIVINLILGQRRLASVGDFLAGPAHIKLHHVAMLGELDSVVVGPLVKLEVHCGSQIGASMEKRRNLAFALHVLHVQPRLAAQSLNHRV